MILSLGLTQPLLPTLDVVVAMVIGVSMTTSTMLSTVEVGVSNLRLLLAAITTN